MNEYSIKRENVSAEKATWRKNSQAAGKKAYRGHFYYSLMFEKVAPLHLPRKMAAKGGNFAPWKVLKTF